MTDRRPAAPKSAKGARPQRGEKRPQTGEKRSYKKENRQENKERTFDNRKKTTPFKEKPFTPKGKSHEEDTPHTFYRKTAPKKPSQDEQKGIRLNTLPMQESVRADKQTNTSLPAM